MTEAGAWTAHCFRTQLHKSDLAPCVCSKSPAPATLGCCVGGAGGGSGRRAVGELAPVGAFVVGSESAGGEYGGGGGVDAGGEESLVLGPGGTVGVGTGGRPLVGCVLGGGAHRVAWEVRQAGAGRSPRRGGGGAPAGWAGGRG